MNKIYAIISRILYGSAYGGLDENRNILYINPIKIYKLYYLPKHIKYIKSKLGYSEIYLEHKSGHGTSRRLYSGRFIKSKPFYKKSLDKAK